MTDKVFNNKVTIIGEIMEGFTFNHDVHGEKFYITHLSVRRLSGVNDIIPIMVSERLVDVKKDYMGMSAVINGQFRSYNYHAENRNHLVLFVFAKEIKIIGEPVEDVYPNYIFLDGFICKPPIYRKTPLGREIADVLLAVNRPYGKSDYIPCICWDKNARLVEVFQVGEHIQIRGNIQSREYQKKITENEFEKRVAYEVSVGKLECVGK